MRVSYETAILAKEKGFKWSTIYEYKSEECVSHRDHIPHDYNSRGLLSAPLQYELQKWLREVHGYHVQPQKTFHNTTYKIGKVPSVRIDDDSDGHPRSYMTPSKKKFKTYEEALEFGMKHVLEFIKMV